MNPKEERGRLSAQISLLDREIGEIVKSRKNLIEKQRKKFKESQLKQVDCESRKKKNLSC